jgi:hypothetical protein
MKKNRLLSYEWDAIAGILAAVIAIILHFLHIIDEHIILPVVLTLMALLFINFMRHTQNNEHTAEQVEHIHKMVTKINLSLAAPDIVLIGPRQQTSGSHVTCVERRLCLICACRCTERNHFSILYFAQ